MTGKRRQIFRTVRAPNTRAGAQAADVALARLIVEVNVGRGGAERSDHRRRVAGAMGRAPPASVGGRARRDSRTGP